MLSLRVSATDVDAFRWFRSDDEADLADFLAQLRRQTPPSPAMLAGTALHSALETAEFGEHGTLSARGYTFEFQIDDEIDLAPTREFKLTRDYTFGDLVVTLVGKVDAVHGRRIDDHKMTARYDAERFLGSFQWRAYLGIFGADVFRWNVFEARELEEKRYRVTALHRLTMHRYPGLTEDVKRDLGAFVDFARAHLPERIMKAAA